MYIAKPEQTHAQQYYLGSFVEDWMYNNCAYTDV